MGTAIDFDTLFGGITDDENIKAQAKFLEEIKDKEENNCGKCSGLGFIPGYAHVANGQCFKCAGSGLKNIRR